MSDLPEDYIEELKSRDERFAALGEAISIEADLRDNPTIKALMKAVRQDSEKAMEDLAEISPLDHQQIALLLVRVKTFVYIRNTLNFVLNRGRAAEQHIRAEDQSMTGEE